MVRLLLLISVALATLSVKAYVLDDSDSSSLLEGTFRSCAYCMAIRSAKERSSLPVDYAPLSVASVIREGCAEFGEEWEAECLEFASDYYKVLQLGMRNEEMNAEEFCENVQLCGVDQVPEQNGVFTFVCERCQVMLIDFVGRVARQVAPRIDPGQTLQMVRRLCSTIAVFGYKDDCVVDMIRRTGKVSVTLARQDLSPFRLCRMYGACLVYFDEPKHHPWTEVVGVPGLPGFSLPPWMSLFPAPAATSPEPKEMGEAGETTGEPIEKAEEPEETASEVATETPETGPEESVSTVAETVTPLISVAAPYFPQASELPSWAASIFGSPEPSPPLETNRFTTPDATD